MGGYDVAAIANDHRPLNDSLVEEWREVAPGSDATLLEFDFRATGNAKRKLLRRLHGHVITRRGSLRVQSATSLKWVEDYALAYDIVARVRRLPTGVGLRSFAGSRLTNFRNGS